MHLPAKAYLETGSGLTPHVHQTKPRCRQLPPFIPKGAMLLN